MKSTASLTPSNGTMSMVLTSAPAATGALLARRGPTTGNKEVPTADPRFHRSERPRVDVPTPSADAVAGRLLDRSGKLLPILSWRPFGTIRTARGGGPLRSRWRPWRPANTSSKSRAALNGRWLHFRSSSEPDPPKSLVPTVTLRYFAFRVSYGRRRLAAAAIRHRSADCLHVARARGPAPRSARQ